MYKELWNLSQDSALLNLLKVSVFFDFMQYSSSHPIVIFFTYPLHTLHFDFTMIKTYSSFIIMY